MALNAIVLSYHDTILRTSDVNILNGNGWLTDSIIAFYLEYLERDVYREYKEDILFVSPSVTQCVKSSPCSEISVFLDPLKAKERKLVFFPLNNNENVHTPGGSHWSLLVYLKRKHEDDGTFYHLDSSNNMNGAQATILATLLQFYFDEHGTAAFREAPSLQQRNDYDCGIYLLCNVENVVKHFLAGRRFEEIPFIEKSVTKQKRAAILNLIKGQSKR